MLDAMITWTSDLVHHSGLHDLIQADPTPTPSGGGRHPPARERGTAAGCGEVRDHARMGQMGCALLLRGGFLVIGARMGYQHKRGEAGGHMGSLAIASAACIIVASAVLFVEKFAGS